MSGGDPCVEDLRGLLLTRRAQQEDKVEDIEKNVAYGWGNLITEF